MLERVFFLAGNSAAKLDKFRLLAGHRESDPVATAVPDRPMATVPTGRLAASILFSGMSAVLIAAVVTLLVWEVRRFDGRQIKRDGRSYSAARENAVLMDSQPVAADL